MPKSPKTYDEWLALTSDQRKEVHLHEWNVYLGDGRAIAVMAGAHLMQSDSRVLDIQIGIWHCGEFVLQPTVSNDDFKIVANGPPQEFEGFRILWRAESYEFNAVHAARFVGKWISENEDVDAEFTIAVESDGFTISGRESSNGEKLEIRHVEFDGHRLEFEVITPSTGRAQLHRFISVDDRHCDSTIVTPVKWKRS